MRGAESGSENRTSSTVRCPRSSFRLRAGEGPTAKVKSGAASQARPGSTSGLRIRASWPADSARRKLITSQRSSAESAPPNGGMPPAGMPWVSHQKRSPAVCWPVCGAVRSAGRLGSPRRRGRRPCRLVRGRPRSAPRRARARSRSTRPDTARRAQVRRRISVHRKGRQGDPEPGDDGGPAAASRSARLRQDQGGRDADQAGTATWLADEEPGPDAGRRDRVIVKR